MLKNKQSKSNIEEKRKSVKGKQSRNNQNQGRLVHISKGLPFSFDNKKQLFKTVDDEYIKMIRVTGINLFGMKEDDQQMRMVTFQKMFNSLLKIGQIYSYEIPADVDGYISDYENTEADLNLGIEQDYIKYEILEENKERLVNTSITREMVDRCFLLIIKDKNIDSLDRRINEALQHLSAFNSAAILSTQEMIEVIYSYYNPRDSLFNKEEVNFTEDIMDYIYPDIIGFVDKGFNQYIKLNGIYCTTLYVSKVTKSEMGFLSTLATYPDVEFSMHFEVAPEDGMKNELDKSVKNMNTNLDREKNASKIAELENKQQQTLELINQISIDDDIPFYFSICIRIKSDTLDDLVRYTEDVKKDINSLGFKMRSGIWQSFDIFNTCSPICMNYIPKYMKQTTNDTLAWGYPFVFENLYDSTPKYDSNKKHIYNYPPFHMGTTNPTGGVVFYDNFTKKRDRANNNEFIAGKSGFGKTTLIMAFIKFRYAIGYHQYVIDVEGKELNRLIYSLGGEVINCANGNNGRINPLQVRIVIPEDTKQPNKKIPLCDIKPLSSHIHFLRSLLKSYKGDSPEIGLLHDRKIEDAIEEVYKDYGITYDTTADQIINRSNEEFPIFSDVYNKLVDYKEEEESKKNINSVRIEILDGCIAFLKPLANGADADVFNGYTNIDINNPLICFDVSGLHDNTSSDILGAQYLNVLSFIWSRMQTEDGTRRIQVYEDELAVIQNPKYMDIISMNEDMVRRCRKYNAGMTFGTQQLMDMLKDSIKEHTSTLMHQSVYQFYFNTDPDSLKYLNSSNLIPNSELEWLEKAEIGQCFAKFGNQTSMRVNVDLGDKTLFEFKELKGEA